MNQRADRSVTDIRTRQTKGTTVKLRYINDPGAGQENCTYVNGSADTQCQTPGNVQINDSPPPVQYTPQYPYWEGGYFGGYSGFHAGGGHR